MKKTLLVTGGAGFIGSNFVHYILDKYPDYRVLVLDALTYAGSVDNLPIEFRDNKNSRGEFWYGNVTNADLVNTLVSKSDAVIHFAAETHVTRSIFDNSLFFHTDVIGTQTIANAVCKHLGSIDRFIHISTSEVYGTATTTSMSEEHVLNPASPYAAAKAGADRLVYSYWYTYKIPAVIIRPFNNYGPRQHLEKAVPRFITSVLLNEQMHIHGDGSAARDFVHVNDTCTAIDAALHAPINKVFGEVFNVGSGVDRSIKSVADDVIKIMGAGSYIPIGNRPGQVFRHTADITKIQEVLKWEPTVTWEDGLKDTVQWYRNNKTLWDKQLWLREIPIVSASGNKELH
jgi:dTDP-glucose 4,6-dehydratase